MQRALLAIAAIAIWSTTSFAQSMPDSDVAASRLRDDAAFAKNRVTKFKKMSAANLDTYVKSEIDGLQKQVDEIEKEKAELRRLYEEREKLTSFEDSMRVAHQKGVDATRTAIKSMPDAARGKTGKAALGALKGINQLRQAFDAEAEAVESDMRFRELTRQIEKKEGDISGRRNSLRRSLLALVIVAPIIQSGGSADAIAQKLEDVSKKVAAQDGGGTSAAKGSGRGGSAKRGGNSGSSRDGDRGGIQADRTERSSSGGGSGASGAGRVSEGNTGEVRGLDKNTGAERSHGSIEGSDVTVDKP